MSETYHAPFALEEAMLAAAQGERNVPKHKESAMLTEPNQAGEVLGHGYKDWPDDLTTFNERKAYQRGVADARAIEAEVAVQAGQEPVAVFIEDEKAIGGARFKLLKPLPTGSALYTTSVVCPKCAEFQASERKLSDAYLRIRQKLNAFDTPHGPTADQVYAHTEVALDALRAKCDLLVIERDAQAVLISDQQAEVDRQTEISNNFAAQVRQQDETITSLRAEVDHRQSLIRESNRNCAEHAGVVWTQVTIAQQAERITELEQQRRQWLDTDLCGMVVRDQEREITEKTAHIDSLAVAVASFQSDQERFISDLTEHAALIEKCEKSLIVERECYRTDNPEEGEPSHIAECLASIAAHRDGA